ncbi:LOG family protein [Pseudonocardia dioxanivorans]|uniref:LOG family protein n=1 Tax=Pseudonocardia dioxanivorans TaxID=240495 RepID=UPI003989AFDC
MFCGSNVGRGEAYLDAARRLGTRLATEASGSWTGAPPSARWAHSPTSFSPPGPGELAEALTWSQLGIHAKPTALLDTAGYYDHFLRFLDHAAEEGFLRAADRALVLSATDPATLLDRLRAWQPRHDRRWKPVKGS